MSAGAVLVSDETVAAVVVALDHHELIPNGERQAVADELATLNRVWVHTFWGERASLHPGAVVGHAWRWRPLAPAVEVLTRLEWLELNLGGDRLALDNDGDLFDGLRRLEVRRLPGYGAAWWRK